MKVFGITGWKNAGKTGLLVRMVTELTARGLSVSTIKHAHHDADIDRPGTDSFRHRTAGAREVLLATPARWALVRELRGATEPPLADLLSRLAPVDLVLVEGFKSAPHPKIEAYRPETGQTPMAPVNPTVRAVATTAAAGDPSLAGLAVPLLALDDTAAITDFLLREVGL